MKILQIALITQKGNVFNVKMQIDEIVFESKEEVREKLLSVFANRKDAVVDVVIHSMQAFNMTTAPKVGDRVKLRYRVVKSHFRSYRDSKIVSVIERADLSNETVIAGSEL